VADVVLVRELGQTLEFAFEDALRYAGPHSPAGVAVGFKALQRAFDLLSPAAAPERRAVAIRTPFRGPGARDCFEIVTRAVTDGRYTVDRTLLRTDRGRLLEDFVFELSLDGATVTLLLRDGFVTDEFIDLARTEHQTDETEARLDALKAQLAQRVLAAHQDEVFDLR
jgi:hypothetical protein